MGFQGLDRNAIVYRGPSLLDGTPIVAGVAGVRHPSGNSKTGPMLQVYVLVDGMTPNEAIVAGVDRAICGDCPLRSSTGVVGRGCYVTWWQGPSQVYKAIRAGKYSDVQSQPVAFARSIAGRAVRFTAYGDIAFVPTRIWSMMLEHVNRWTAYTHQWRTCDQDLRAFAMASVGSRQEYLEARAMGWRTFRVRQPGEPLADDEFVCPASREGRYRSTCLKCNLCRGTATAARNVAIYPHGQRAKWVK